MPKFEHDDKFSLEEWNRQAKELAHKRLVNSGKEIIKMFGPEDEDLPDDREDELDNDYKYDDYSDDSYDDDDEPDAVNIDPDENDDVDTEFVLT